MRQADAFQQRHAALARFATAGAFEHQRRQRQVVHDRQVREQVELLEYKADMAAQRIQPLVGAVDIFAVHFDPSLLDRFEPVDRAYQRGLARTRWAANHNHFAATHLRAHIGQRLISAIPLLHLENRIMRTPF